MRCLSVLNFSPLNSQPNPFPVPTTSPLSLVSTSVFSEMPWTEVAPGKIQRPIGENETFIKLVGDSARPLHRERKLGYQLYRFL